MKKVISIIVLASLATSAGAADVKKPIQYNKEATLKLQEKLNPINSLKDIINVAKIDFLTSVDQLLTQGADPNIARAEDNEDTLMVLLFSLSGFNKDENFAALNEKVIKYALEHGASLDIKGDKGSSILRVAIAVGHPALVKLVIEHGTDVTQKDDEGNTPLTALELAIKEIKNELPTISEPIRSSFQKILTRMEQIRDILIAAQQKK